MLRGSPISPRKAPMIAHCAWSQPLEKVYRPESRHPAPARRAAPRGGGWRPRSEARDQLPRAVQQDPLIVRQGVIVAGARGANHAGAAWLGSGCASDRDRRFAFQHQAIQETLLVHVVIWVGLVHD